MWSGEIEREICVIRIHDGSKKNAFTISSQFYSQTKTSVCCITNSDERLFVLNLFLKINIQHQRTIPRCNIYILNVTIIHIFKV